MASQFLKRLEEKEIRSLNKLNLPIFSSGDIITVKYLSSFTKKKRQVFTGICIRKKNRGINSSFTIRSNFHSENVEQSFSLYSPFIDQIVVEERKKIRASKLYYLRKKNLLHYMK